MCGSSAKKNQKHFEEDPDILNDNITETMEGGLQALRVSGEGRQR